MKNSTKLFVLTGIAGFIYLQCEINYSRKELKKQRDLYNEFKTLYSDRLVTQAKINMILSEAVMPGIRNKVKSTIN